MKSMKWFAIVLLVALAVLAACQRHDVVDSEQPAEVLEEGEPVSEQSAEVSEEGAPGPEQPAEIPEEDETGPEQPVEEPEEAAPIPDTTEDESEAPADAPEAIPAEPLLDNQKMLDFLGNYLLRPDDMPHAFYIPEGGEQHTNTMRLIQMMGEIPAKTYVKETGRIDGWWLKLKRVSKADFAPSIVESSIELFETAEGAQNAMMPEHSLLQVDEDSGFTPVDGGCDLGDRCGFYTATREDPATNIVTVKYKIAFTYRNALVWVMAQGIEIDMEPDYVLKAASTLLSKLETAPTQ